MLPERDNPGRQILAVRKDALGKTVDGKRAKIRKFERTISVDKTAGRCNEGIELYGHPRKEALATGGWDRIIVYA